MSNKFDEVFEPSLTNGPLRDFAAQVAMGETGPDDMLVYLKNLQKGLDEKNIQTDNLGNVIRVIETGLESSSQSS